MDATTILLLLDFLLQAEHPRPRRKDQLLRLAYIEQRCRTASGQNSRQAERVLTRCQRAARDFELQVKCPQAKVSAGHISHQLCRDLSASPLTCHKVGACRFRRPTKASPEI